MTHYSYSCIHACTHTHAHARTHAHAHTHTHTHTLHAHTHIATHTPMYTLTKGIITLKSLGVIERY